MSDPSAENLELRQRLKVLEEELMRAQRLSSVGALASSITHEFNNILTTVINYAKMGLRHGDEATRTKSFDRILSAGQRAPDGGRQGTSEGCSDHSRPRPTHHIARASWSKVPSREIDSPPGIHIQSPGHYFAAFQLIRGDFRSRSIRMPCQFFRRMERLCSAPVPSARRRAK